jgi:hypothetical protein
MRTIFVSLIPVYLSELCYTFIAFIRSHVKWQFTLSVEAKVHIMSLNFNNGSSVYNLITI